MTILNLNGYAVNIVPGSLKRGALDEIGSTSDSYKGYLRDSTRARRRTWSATAVVDTTARMESLEQLIAGRALHIPFDAGLYSDKTGVGPTTGYTAVLAAAAPAPKFGAYRLQVPSAGYIGWRMDAPIGATWSMAWWFSTGGAWTHYCAVSLKGVVTNYVSGVVSGAALSNYLVFGVLGVLSEFGLQGKDTAGVNSATAYFDDLVIFPGTALNADIVAAFASSTIAQSSLPFLNLTGDLIDESGPVEVRGKLGEVRFIEGNKSGYKNNLRVVDFSLVETKPYR